MSIKLINLSNLTSLNNNQHHHQIHRKLGDTKTQNYQFPLRITLNVSAVIHRLVSLEARNRQSFTEEAERKDWLDGKW